MRPPACHSLRWLLAGALLAALGLAARGRRREALLLAGAAHATFSAAAAIPNHALAGPLVKRFHPNGREIWLTIDDGPHPGSTPAILRALHEHDARATFFLIGERAAAHPGLVRAIVGAGHTLGNHTFCHPSATFWTAGPRRIAREIDRTATAIHRAGAPRPRYFRPPVGMANLFVAPILQRRGLIRIGWSARAFDTRSQPAGSVVTRIMRHCSPGAIILFHESGPAAGAAALDELLTRLRAESFRCVLPPDDALIAEGGWP